MPDLELVWSFGETNDREAATHLLRSLNNRPDANTAYAFCGYVRSDRIQQLPGRSAEVTLLRCYLNPATCSECNKALTHARLIARRGYKTAWERLNDGPL